MVCLAAQIALASSMIVAQAAASGEGAVLRWMEAVQDSASTDQRLIPSMEDNRASTFDNALAAMAFIVAGKRERAERILQFFADSVSRDNQDKTLQSFYLAGDPRGFWQYVKLRPEGGVAAFHADGPCDRWMGDMAWLLLACKLHEKSFSSNRFAALASELRNLLVSYYVELEPGKGYVRHGWRKGDSKLHELDGHHEGNIDCAAVFRLTGDQKLSDSVRAWVDSALSGAKDLPLDLYSWRALERGSSAARLLEVPENDPRYHKSLRIGGRVVQGFFHGPWEADARNIWVDGTAHMACAYWAVGNRERAEFYSRQLDLLLMDRTIAGVACKALPYTANKTSGYDWVALDRGSLSAAAWYVFAKRKFNPLRLEYAR